MQSCSAEHIQGVKVRSLLISFLRFRLSDCPNELRGGQARHDDQCDDEFHPEFRVDIDTANASVIERLRYQVEALVGVHSSPIA
jgi:hypothetical protein